LHPDSVLDYISAFGTQGVNLQNGVLEGVPAGFQIGRIGNTGAESTGPHLDLLVEERNRRGGWQDIDPLLVFTSLEDVIESDWSKVYAGYDEPVVTRDVLWNMWRNNDHSSSYSPWKKFMTPEAKELGVLLEVWDH
jgi:murein DD-endopeptidase MepM/ murein hydrolase activator NlpD